MVEFCVWDSFLPDQGYIHMTCSCLLVPVCMCVHIVMYVLGIVSTDKIVPLINTLVIIIIINNLSALPSHAAVVSLFPAGGGDAWRADGIQWDVAQAAEHKGRCVETTSSGAGHAPWACTFSLFVSIPQLKLWGSLNVGWEGSVCNHFPTHCRTYKCSVTRFSNSWTPTSGISIMEFVVSWRLRQLKVILTWDSKTQHTCCFSPNVLTRDNNMPMMPVSIVWLGPSLWVTCHAWWFYLVFHVRLLK